MPIGRKKFHHYIQDAYIDAWRKPVAYVYNIQKKKAYPKSGRDIGGETGFNVFRFDDKVIDLLRYSFERRPGHKGNLVYWLMVDLLVSTRDVYYPNKVDNWIEDFYGRFEAGIGNGLLRASEGDQLNVPGNSSAFDSLILFFCLQFFRTPQLRGITSDLMRSINHGGHELDEQQKREYIKMRLVVDSLAMAADLLHKGCRILLRDVQGEAAFATCDAPVVVNAGRLKSVEELKGWVPLNPSLLMQIDQIGVRTRLETRGGIGAEEVHQRNLRLIQNAEREVIFGSELHRARYLDHMEKLEEPA